MDKQELCIKINKIRNKVDELLNNLYALEIADTGKYFNDYEKLSTETALLAEKIACNMRHLIYSTTSLKKSEFIKDVAKEHNIKVKCVEKGFMIEIPSLLPKRKSGKSSEFITDPLFYALSEFALENAPIKYDNCVVCFVHIYDRNLSEGRIRDYDNIELKQILDVIATFFMKDDSGKCCDMFNTTQFGETDCTRIYIVKKSDFEGWILRQQ